MRNRLFFLAGLMLLIVVVGVRLWFIEARRGTVTVTPPQVGSTVTATPQPASSAGAVTMTADQIATFGVWQQFVRDEAASKTPQQRDEALTTALSSLQKIDSEHPDYLYAHWVTGGLLVAKKDVTGAIAMLEKTISLCDTALDTPAAQRAEAKLQCMGTLVILEHAAGNPSKGDQYLREVLELAKTPPPPELQGNTFSRFITTFTAYERLGPTVKVLEQPSLPPPFDTIQKDLMNVIKLQDSDPGQCLKILEDVHAQVAAVGEIPNDPFWALTNRNGVLAQIDLVAGRIALKQGDTTLARARFARAVEESIYVKAFVPSGYP